MDHILHLESEIRKAQTNKEIVVAVFSPCRKSYVVDGRPANQVRFSL